ncbi:MlaD family protein [Nocardia sp. alder85J]|uniref:MlaD family protein n=1 Tax=Nocardia sp. alder85J TaxID=2862949 RepID=UPI001CD38BEF|nr:MlaD family protein [Nocardia sp. alder85J]MCX4091759.1 MlaD family protein [Nocardia sp. alder85J]
MTGEQSMRISAGERAARGLVDTVRALTRRRTLLSALGLLAILVFAAGYLSVGALQLDPWRSHYRVTVELTESGGLLPNQDVTLRGVRVGRVTSVRVHGETVLADAEIDGGVRIPASGTVRVSALSAAGEQYLDFVPTADGGPYLSDGSVVTADRTSTPVALSTVLGDFNGTLAQIDPAKLQAITRELGAGPDGPRKLQSIVDGGMFLVSTLDSVLPQTLSLLHNSTLVLTTMADVAPGLRATAANLAGTAGGIARMTGGFDTLVAQTPGLTATLDAIIADNSPTMVQLLGNLVTVSQMSYVHIPALQEFFFPQQRAGSALDAVNSAFHDGVVWALVSVYPRRACDYEVPRRAATVPDFPPPYVNAHCTDPDPTLLTRGARNAPRPPGDDTAYAAPGSDPLATADPTPAGPLSIPTPYGGSWAPSYVPPR